MRIKAVHYQEARAAVQELWSHQSGITLASWRSAGYPHGGAAAGARAYAADLNDPRYWLNKYEETSTYSIMSLPSSNQGVDSFSYAASTSRAVINHPDQPGEPDWVNDIAALSQYQKPWVRCNIVPNSVPDPKDQFQDAVTIPRYNVAFDRYSAGGIRVFALLGPEFRPVVRGTPMDSLNALDSDTFSNAYIDDFAARAAHVSARFPGVRDFIIWNEPNDWIDYTEQIPKGTKSLTPAHFGALMHHTCQNIRAYVPDARVYCGGILFGPGYEFVPDQHALEFIRDVYRAMKSEISGVRGLPEVYDVETPPWPWSGVNAHFHRNTVDPVTGENWERKADQYAYLFTSLLADGEDPQAGWLTLKKIREEQSDFGGYDADSKRWHDVLVGEWGVTEDEVSRVPRCLNTMFHRIDRYVWAMFLFKHPRWEGDGGVWGFRQYHEVSGDPGVFSPDYEQAATNIHEPYVSAINGRD